MNRGEDRGDGGKKGVGEGGQEREGG